MANEHERRRRAARRIERWYHQRKNTIQFRVIHREFRVTGLVAIRTLARHSVHINTLLYFYPDFAPAINIVQYVETTMDLNDMNGVWSQFWSYRANAFVKRIRDVALAGIAARHCYHDTSIAMVLANANNDLGVALRVFGDLNIRDKRTASSTRPFTPTELRRHADAIDLDALRRNPHYRPMWERCVDARVDADEIRKRINTDRAKRDHVYLYPDDFDLTYATRIFPNRLRPGYVNTNGKCTYRAAYVQWLWRVRRRRRVVQILSEYYTSDVSAIVIAYATQIDTSKI